MHIYQSSIEDELLVHCHGGCEFEPRDRTLVFVCVFFGFIFLSIYLFIDIVRNYLQTILAAEYRFNDSKQCISY